MNATPHKHTNALIRESSPYLLQHAHNPVNWLAWNDAALEKAKTENKLILISVGYSACHWCHVMEHESFEDENVARLMNDHFVCIKVDREERPDIDQVYMLAVQLMTGHGGWPLNCFALPDGRPIYGGTYFPKNNWMNILLNLADLWKHEPQKAEEYAKQLTEGVRVAELVKVNTDESAFNITTLRSSVAKWKERIDNVEGGPDKAPKFPLPNNYQFLLRYAHLSGDQELLNHVNLTLKKMAFGGIYDQVGGGFSRYSVDHFWKVPHFEKMLYDNAQLVSLYCEAYQKTKDPLYKDIVFETLSFVERELLSPDGGFHAALDADSEGEEGKYYVWTKPELQEILKETFTLFADYYNVNERGFWEHENYILLRHEEDEQIAARHQISVGELKTKMSESKKLLLEKREKRIRPGLDNKIITSWNAMMTKAFADAYSVFDENHFKEVALDQGNYILKNCGDDHCNLYHLNNQKINGFLEDYAHTIEMCIALYEISLDEEYLHEAQDLMDSVQLHFTDKSTGMFFYTSDQDKALISRKMELSDNVIPASNSSVANSLFHLGHHFGRPDYIALSRKMLNNVLPELENYGAGYSNWSILLLHFTFPFHELAIVGKSVDEKRKELQKHYLPNKIFAGSASESSLPLLQNRHKKDDTLIYVCRNNSCSAPVKEMEDAFKQMQAE